MEDKFHFPAFEADCNLCCIRWSMSRFSRGAGPNNKAFIALSSPGGLASSPSANREAEIPVQVGYSLRFLNKEFTNIHVVETVK